MIRSHTFKDTKYLVEFCDRIDGVTDTPYDPNDKMVMRILSGNNLRAFHSALHEAMEASMFCDKCLHDKDGSFATWDIARFLWRWMHLMGYKSTI